MPCFPLLGTLGAARAQLGGLPHRVHCLTLAGVNTCAGVLAAAHADMGGIPQCAQLHQHRFNPLGGSKHRTQYLLPHRARPRCPESPPRRRQPAPPSRLATSGPHRTPSKASKNVPTTPTRGHYLHTRHPGRTAGPSHRGVIPPQSPTKASTRLHTFL